MQIKSDKESLQWLSEQTAKSLDPIKLLERKDRVVLYNRASDTVGTVELPAEPRRHLVRTVEDFAVACFRWRSDHNVIFHAEKEVVCLLDVQRRERIVLPLEFTHTYCVVAKLEKEQFDQRGFLRLLRFDLADVIPANLVTAIQKIEVVTSGNQRSEITPGRERGTREFAADLTASGEIPDRVVCVVPVYQTPGLDVPVQIKFALEYTLPPQPVTFRFAPVGDELARVLRVQQGVLRALLEEAIHEVFEVEKNGILPPTILFGNAEA